MPVLILLRALLGAMLWDTLVVPLPTAHPATLAQPEPVDDSNRQPVRLFHAEPLARLV